MVHLKNMTIEKAFQLIQSKALSPAELIDEYLKRIDKAEPVIKAWAAISDKKELRARAASLMRVNGHARSPLFSIPYGVKDIIHVKGLPLEAGSKILKGNVSKKNATIISKLNNADALLLGKTTTAEFASGGGAPDTKNPWRLTHTPGGSSSGSAAALASDMVLFSIGTQTSGSVMRPAAYNGLTALKPTFGQISKSGIIPASWSIDGVGIFTKNVRDIPFVYNELAGYDIKDKYTHLYKNEKLTLTLDNTKNAFRIGVLEDDYFEATNEVMAAFSTGIKQLEQLGHTIHSCIMPPVFEKANTAHGIIVDSETAALHDSYFDDKKNLFSPELRNDIKTGRSYSAVTYHQAQDTRWKYKNQCKQLFKDIDVLLTPTTPETAPKGLKKTGSPKFNKPFSNAGLPTLTLPAGFSAQNGLPIGMQLIANYNCEQQLIDIGEQFQRMTDFHLKSPDIF